MYLYPHTAHTPDSSSWSHLAPFPRSSLQVCSRTDTGCRRRPPAVLNISYRSPLGTKTSVRAEAEKPRRRASRCGCLSAGTPRTLARRQGTGPPAGRKWCSGEQVPLAEGRGEAARKRGRRGRAAVPGVLLPPIQPLFCPHPTRLGVRTFPPPLSLPAWGKGWHLGPRPRRRLPGADGRAGAVAAHWPQSSGAAGRTLSASHARKPGKQARLAAFLRRGVVEGGGR